MGEQWPLIVEKPVFGHSSTLSVTRPSAWRDPADPRFCDPNQPDTGWTGVVRPRLAATTSSPYGEFAFIENVKPPKTHLRVFHWKVCPIGTLSVKRDGNYFLCEQNLDKEEEAD